MRGAQMTRILALLFGAGAVLAACARPSPAQAPTVTVGEPTLPPTRTPPPALATTRPSPTPAPRPEGKIVFTCQVTRRSDQNQICLMDADGSDPHQLTDQAESDHLYASLSPTGDSVVFSSNRAGGYDIYELTLAADDALNQLSRFGDAFAPAISPDGKRIVFTRSDGTRRQLWLMGRSGTDPVPVTDPSWGRAWDASWSPDGTHILLASDQPGSTQLFNLDLATGVLGQVTSLAGLRGRNDWSPDGKMVSTYQGESWSREIVEIDLESGGVRTLTGGGNNLAPSYSPDGKWLAFTSYRDNYLNENGCEIYILHRSSGEIRRLTENDYCDWQPRWGR